VGSEGESRVPIVEAWYSLAGLVWPTYRCVVVGKYVRVYYYIEDRGVCG